MKRFVTLLILLLAMPAWGQPRAKPQAKTQAPTPRAVGLDGTLTWSGAGGDQNWQTSEIVGEADMDEIKTEVDACFSSADGGTFSAGNLSITGNFSAVAGAFTGAVTAPSFTADASATPQLIFDDSVATGNEAIVRGDAVADNAGRIELLVEGGTAATYQSGVTVCSTAAGVVKTLLGPSVIADGVAGNTCATPAGAGWQIDEAGVLSPINGGTYPLPTKNVTRTCDWNIEAPVTGDDGNFQCLIPVAATLTRAYCSTKGASTTVTINLQDRADTAPDTATTNRLGSNIVCDTDGQGSIIFTGGGAVAADQLLALAISAVSGSPTLVRVHVEYTID